MCGVFYTAHSTKQKNPSGYPDYPKAVPLALTRKIRDGKHMKIDLYTGASVGSELEGELVRVGAIDRCSPYQSDRDVRDAINSGKLKYADLHLSMAALDIRYGFFSKRRGIDVAIIEACLVRGLGHGMIGIVPTTSMGNSATFVKMASQVIIEINVTQPVELEGIHDSYIPLDPPARQPVTITRATDRVGTPYIPCELSKVAAIVPCDIPDKTSTLKDVDENAEKMGYNLLTFLKNEVEEGRLPENLLPLQFGVGSVANMVGYSWRRA